MISKIIHYCWLSNDPIPADLQKCMESWKKYLPDYEFMLWNFERFPKSQSKWVSDAFDNKKYAFAADYIRLYALYNYGGIYLDMDVEILQNIDKFLSLKTMLCFQNDGGANTLEVAAFGVEKKSPWIKDCLDSYNSDHFLVLKDGKKSFNELTLPVRVRDVLKGKGYNIIPVSTIEQALTMEDDCSIPVFDHTYFSPKSYVTGRLDLSVNTYAIHHFAGSWETKWTHCKSWFRYHFLFLYKIMRLK